MQQGSTPCEKKIFGSIDNFCTGGGGSLAQRQSNLN